jgi:hypothetical protein
MTLEEFVILDEIYEKAKLMGRDYHPILRFIFNDAEYKIGCAPYKDENDDLIVKWHLAFLKSNHIIVIEELSPETIYNAIQYLIIREIHRG